MRNATFWIATLFLAIACGGSAPQNTTTTAHDEVRTVESTDPRPAVIDPPPMLSDEAAAPKPKNPIDAERAVPLTPQDEQIRARLPFASAIAMDPVDGSKVSIRATTPVAQYKNRLYYFSSESNKQAFMAAPESYTKGAFSHL
jgi:YHS domain-containing protein